VLPMVMLILQEGFILLGLMDVKKSVLNVIMAFILIITINAFAYLQIVKQLICMEIVLVVLKVIILIVMDNVFKIVMIIAHSTDILMLVENGGINGLMVVKRFANAVNQDII